MTKRRKRNHESAGSLKTGRDNPSASPKARLAGSKLWLFWAFTLVGVPVVFLGLLELTLRLAGFGHSTAFLLRDAQNGRDVFTQNNQFAWRFFGPHMGRLPEPLFFAQRKPPGTIRIFLFGESAAQGDPQPAFGPARLLQAILSQRHPETRFEVVNAAMTAINSHTVLPIARDCANADGDIWVVYMGNNEVVGPFGAGTVFGHQTPPLALIRATLALKATRTGQLMDSLLAALQKASPEKGEWRGMEMFLEQQVRADDLRMKGVYENFERNLSDILRIGQRSGVGIVVSTVAVNLKDCAPFASAHRTGLTVSDKSKWENHYQLGRNAQDAGRNQEAEGHFKAAAQLDDTFAELRFRQGLCAQALGRLPEADAHFRAALDLDTLRFRCDSRLNALIRQATSNREPERILLADVERAFAEPGREGWSDGELFYEHVHPTFKGNYLLAKTLAGQVEKLLPKQAVARNAAALPWPSEADCAHRLAWADWSRLAALDGILVRVSAPPFTGQLNHAAQLESLHSLMGQLSPALEPAGIAEVRKLCEAALATAPNDPTLHGHLAALKLMASDLDGAVAAERRELELLPSSAQAWLRLGLILAQQKKHVEAVAAFRRAIALDPADVMYRQNLAQSLWLLGRRDEAIAELKRAVKFQPNFSLGWISLGQLLEESGRQADAESCYQKALACRAYRTSDLLALARFCRSRGWHEAALTNFNQARNLNPQDAKLRLETGQCLLALRRFADAERLAAEAVRISPDSALAHQLYGSALGQQGKAVDAEQQFREAMRLSPDLLEARLNLGIALMSQGRSVEALTQLEDVLQRSPTNELARRYARTLRSGETRPKAPR